jgi:restriction modification system, type I
MEYKLSDLFDLQMGKTPDRHTPEYWADGTEQWISIADLSKCDKYIEETAEAISEQAVNDSGIKIIPASTVIMSFKLSIGKVAITPKPMYSNEAIMAFIDKGVIPIEPTYLYFLLKAKDWDEGTNKAVMGKTLNKATLSQVKVHIHDMAEQRKIIRALEKAESMVTTRRQQLAALDTLIKARFVELFGDSKVNPYGFNKVRLEDSCEIVTGNTPSRTVDDYYGDYIEWIKTDNIIAEMMYPTRATESLSEVGLKVGRYVEKGAILMACIAGSVASIGKVCITDRQVAFNQQINAIVPKRYNALFLYVLLQTSKDYLVEELNMALKGILSKSKLGEKTFILPPMDQQNDFAAFVAQVDKSKAVVQAAHVIARNLHSRRQQKCRILNF